MVATIFVDERIKIGCRVTVTSIDGVFTGKVVVWEATRPRISIQNAVNCLDKKNSAGNMNFCGNEIIKVELEETSSLSSSLSSASSTSTLSHNSNLNGKNKIISNHKKETRKPIDQSSEISEVVDENGLTFVSQSEQANVSMMDDLDEIDLTGYNYVLISDYGTSASILRNVFEGCKEVGVRVYSNEWSRYGRISLVSLSLKDWNYLFDLASIEREKSEHAKKVMRLLAAEVLSNPAIKKVVHDVPIVSDMLFHQFNIKIKNFFDLEMASRTIFEKSDSMSIESLIYELLKNQAESKVCATMADLDWAQRPLNDTHKYFIIRETSCLSELYQVIQRKIIQKFEITCEQNCEKVMKCNDQEYAKKYNENIFKFNTKLNNKREQIKLNRSEDSSDSVSSKPQSEMSNSFDNNNTDLDSMSGDMSELPQKIGFSKLTDFAAKIKSDTNQNRSPTQVKYNFRPAGSSVQQNTPKKTKA